MKKRKYTGYVCTTASDYEFGETDVKVYASVAQIKREAKCSKECGITKVTITVEEEVEHGSQWKKSENPQT